MDAENIEYIGEKIFLEEIEATGEIWVAKGVYQNVYAMELDETGLSLPVWSSRERVIDFLKHAHLIGTPYQPHAVSVDLFTKAWLSDQAMNITELQINPDGRTTRVLCLTTAEFQSSQH